MLLVTAVAGSRKLPYATCGLRIYRSKPQHPVNFEVAVLSVTPNHIILT